MPEIKIGLQFLKQLPALSTLSTAELMKISECLEPVHPAPGEIILQQEFPVEEESGELLPVLQSPPDLSLWFLRQGEVLVQRQTPDHPEETKTLARLEGPDVFGEISGVLGIPTPLSFQAAALGDRGRGDSFAQASAASSSSSSSSAAAAHQVEIFRLDRLDSLSLLLIHPPIRKALERRAFQQQRWEALEEEDDEFHQIFRESGMEFGGRSLWLWHSGLVHWF